MPPSSPAAERKREDQNEIKRVAVDKQSCGNRKRIGREEEVEGWKRRKLEWGIEGF